MSLKILQVHYRVVLQDSGRLDESRLTEGRMLVKTALITRSMAPEDRVQAAIDANELDRGENIIHSAP